MDNALKNENLENQGEVTNNVGQDENQTQNDGTSDDWETQAKYFQSEKDKLQTENQKLKDYEQVDIGEGGGKGYPFYLVKKNKIDADTKSALIKHNAHYA